MAFELALVGIVILIGFIGNLIFKKTDIPSIIWLMLLGLILGPILHYLNQAPFLAVSDFFSAIAIIIILFEGGIDMDLFKILKEAPKGAILTIIAFALTIVVTAIIVMIMGIWIKGVTILHGILLGAIVGGTSSAVVIPIVSKLKGISDKAKMVLSIESAITDVLCIVTAIAIIQTMSSGQAGINFILTNITAQFSIGIILGALIGIIWLWIMQKIKQQEYSYVVTLGILFIIYSVVNYLNGSGAIACLTFGIILGNGRRILRGIGYGSIAYEIDQTSRNFHKLISFLIRTFFFVFLGLLVSIQNPVNILIGIIISTGILFTRPLAVKVISKGNNDFTELDKKIIGVMMPRGLAAAVLAYMPMAALPHDSIVKSFADIAFTVILVTTIIATVGTIYYKRKQAKEEKQKEEVKKQKEKEAEKIPKPNVIELNKKKTKKN